jgi:branched-chain amino acid transport system ATP-binding protein
MAELHIDHLSLKFGGLVVLDDLSLSLEPGQILALIGPNGAGKTSVLNCISGIYRGTGGIWFHGQNLSGRPPHEIARLGIARTFQHGELFPEMTVIDNLLTGSHTRIKTNPIAEILRLPNVRHEEERQREEVDNIIDFVGLREFSSATVSSLSFGIQKMVGFARALALKPALLLLDEPSAGLNSDERRSLARFILRTKHRLNIATIWIEHDMQMIADLADRIHVLEYGRTLAVGTPETVLRDRNVIAAYLGGDLS